MDWGEGLPRKTQAGVPACILSPPSCPQAPSVLLSQGGHGPGRGLPLLVSSSQAAVSCFPGNLPPGWRGEGDRYMGEGSEEQVESHRLCHFRTGLGSPSLALAQGHLFQLPFPCHS